MASIALTFSLSGQVIHVGAAVRSAYRSADEGEAASGATHVLTLYALRDSLQLSDLDVLLVREAPARAIVPVDADAAARAKVEKLLERHGVEVTEHRGAFRWPSGAARRAEAEAALASALGREALSAGDESVLSAAERPNAAGALAALMGEHGILGSAGDPPPEEHAARYLLRLGDLGRYMRLDSAAADAVMLLRDASSARASATSSLFGVLNHCRSKMGERMLEQWLRQPLLDPAAIAKRHDIVELLAGLASERDALRDGTLKGLPDLDRLSVALRQQNAKLIDIYRLYTFTTGSVPALLDGLRAVLAAAEGDSARTLREQIVAPLEEAKASFSGFDEMVETVLDLSQLPDVYIRPEYDEDLAGARAELDDARDVVFAIHETLTRQFCDATDRTFDEAAEREKWPVKLESASSSRSSAFANEYSLRLPKTLDEDKLRDAFGGGVEIIAYLKNGVHFTTRELSDAAEAVVSAAQSHDAQQSELLAKVVKTAATFMPVIEAAARVVAELDVFLAFAQAVRAADARGDALVRA